eukprot:scaffold6899_cov183-Amphora_coffeaeformis.AAC.36
MNGLEFLAEAATDESNSNILPFPPQREDDRTGSRKKRPRISEDEQEEETAAMHELGGAVATATIDADTNDAQGGSVSSSFSIIQPWHVVLGDFQAWARTTPATTFLREIKDEFKKSHFGQSAKMWIPKAKLAFRERLPEKFPADKYHDIPNKEMGKVLLKCWPAALKAEPRRIVNINVYGYPGDDAPTYGEALWDSSIEFFLRQRDAPNLSSELKKHRRQLDKLRESTQTHLYQLQYMMDRFQKALVFFQETQDAAGKGDDAAKAFLDSCNAITALNKQWKKLLEFKG